MSTTEIQSAAPKRHRRWFQFGLRSLLLLVSLLALPLGWLGWQAAIVRERKAMVTELRQVGGARSVIETGDLFNAPQFAMPWYRRLLGDVEDTDCALMLVPTSISERAAEIRRLFPRSEVIAFENGSLHDPNAKHPAEVARIMQLLPQIPAETPDHGAITMLGLPKWDDTHFGHERFAMVWKHIAPGYYLTLGFDAKASDDYRLKFRDATFSALMKPSFPPDEYHAFYHYPAEEDRTNVDCAAIYVPDSMLGQAPKVRQLFRRSEVIAFENGNPHAPDAKHPDEVLRIMRLLPKIPQDAPCEKVIEMLGLPEKYDGGHANSEGCTMVWKHIAPGYHFELSFSQELESKGKEARTKFDEGGFSAAIRPGFPPYEYHTIYPYRSREGMEWK